MIIIIIIIKMENSGGEEGVPRERSREKNVFFFLFTSFLDLRKSDRRFSSGLKAKLTPKSWSFEKLREVRVLSYLKLHFV